MMATLLVLRPILLNYLNVRPHGKGGGSRGKLGGAFGSYLHGAGYEHDVHALAISSIHCSRPAK
jgi:hypothetical protein